MIDTNDKDVVANEQFADKTGLEHLPLYTRKKRHKEQLSV